MIARKDIVISILFDNYSYDKAEHLNLQSLWGFSCLIETPDKTILFDTGSNGRVLLKNMAKMNKEISSIDSVFLSHHHWDHIGGLDSIIELNADIDIIVPSSLSKLMLKDLKTQVKQVTTIKQNTTQIYSDIYSTGTIGDDVQEQSLIIDCEEGLIVITGCAHNGIVNIVRQAYELFNKDIMLLVGGFHLMAENSAEISQVISELQKKSIHSLCPTHCTGKLAKQMFKEGFHSRYIEVGLGKVL